MVRLDGTPVVKKGAHMQSLTTEQKKHLVNIITKDFGKELEIEKFTDSLLGLLEDVAGFETANQRTINQLTQQLWRLYHV
jgi:hypothetical protein